MQFNLAVRVASVADRLSFRRWPHCQRRCCVEATPSFTYCGVDCFGSFYVRHKRSDIPRYGVIFTCLMSRAMHLEVADTMDKSSFINALRRFIANRGPIRQLRCDGGTNFVGAKNELARKYEAMDQNKIKQYYRITIVTILSSNSMSHMLSTWVESGRV